MSCFLSVLWHILWHIHITSLIAFLSCQLLSLHVSIWLIISSLFIHIRRVFILRDSVSGETQGYSWNHVWWCSQIDWGYTLQPLQHTITISPIWLTAPVLHPPIQSLLTWSLSSPAQTADKKSFRTSVFEVCAVKLWHIMDELKL